MVKDSTQYKIAQQTNAANFAMNAQNNITNLALANAQNQFDLNMWHFNNAYNSPAEQVKRLMAAGLSPSAASQMVGNFESQPTQSAELANQQATQFQAPDMSASLNPLQMVQQVLQTIGQEMDLQSKQKELEYQEPFILSDLSKRHWMINSMRQDFLHQAAVNPYNERSQQYILESIMRDAYYKKLANEYQEYANKRIKQDYDFLIDKNKKDLDVLEQTLNNLVEEGNNLKKQGSHIEAQTAHEKAQTALTDATTENVTQDTINKRKEATSRDLDIISKEMDNALKAFGYPSSVAEVTSALISQGLLSPDEFVQYQNNLMQNLKKGQQVLVEDTGEEEYYRHVYAPWMSKDDERGVHTLGFYNGLRTMIKGKARKNGEFNNYLFRNR